MIYRYMNLFVTDRLTEKRTDKRTDGAERRTFSSLNLLCMLKAEF